MKYLYMEAANGMMVRVPEDKLDQWQKAQDEQRKMSPQERENWARSALAAMQQPKAK